MGHKISKEQIDPGVKDYIMSFVGDINELETDDKSNIINAVNSLMVDRVDNAENMGKLANAIGEPVTANHSVDEVVEGLGELLSTFKTNMMNSGVMVESGDKFKALIDKIKGLTEGEGNKGIKYAEGTFEDISTNGVRSASVTLNYNLNFTPTIIFLQINKLGSYDLYANINNIDNNDSNNAYIIAPGGRNYYMFLNGVTDKSCVLNYYFADADIYSPISGIKYYAIGVGEEDTTLRDSLADILENKGVGVTEEDDMASLISKVDGLNLGGVDIISSASLPASVKDRQLVVVTDTPMTGAVFHNLQPSIGSGIQEGNIWINTTNNNDVFEYIVSDSPKFSFYILDCYQVISGSYVKKQIYCGVNGTWQHVNPNLYFIQEFINDKPLTKIDGSFANTYNAGTGCQRLRYNTNGGNHSVGGTHKTVKTFNTTGFSKVGIRFSVTHASTVYLRFYDVTTNSQLGVAYGGSSTTVKTLELDIANINDLCYIHVDIDSNNNVSGDYIVDIYDLYLTN